MDICAGSVCRIFVAVLFGGCLTQGLSAGVFKTAHAKQLQEPPKPDEALLRVEDRFNEFDWNLTKLVGARAKSNVILSPISVKLVLSMLYSGAGGATAEELSRVLHLEGANSTDRYVSILQSLAASHPGYELNVGMKLFVDKTATPKKNFKDAISKVYNATIDTIDFSNTTSAVAKINEWSKAVTKGHIEHLLSEADESTVLLLLNAVYFNGQWKNPFDVKNTSEGEFFVEPGKTVKVQYMVAEMALDYVDMPKQKTTMVKLPYMGDKFAMYIVLPDNDTTIDNVMAKMSPNTIRKHIDKMSQLQVLISLPKFNFEFASSLAPVLQQLGINKIFSFDADLRNIAEGSKDLVVSNVIQKAQIEIDEKGTVAAAVAAVELVNKFGMMAIPFNVSHPFGFFIMDEQTRAVVFVGKVTDPSDPGKAKVNAKPQEVQVPVMPSQPGEGQPMSGAPPPSDPVHGNKSSS